MFRLVILEPDRELPFIQAKGDTTGQLKSILTITNLSKENVAYKVKTTAPRYYVVKPNQGIMEGNQKILIEISYIPSAVSRNDIMINSCFLQKWNFIGARI